MSNAEIRTRLDAIHDKILNDERIDRDDALLLHRQEELNALGALADLVRRRKHDGRTAPTVRLAPRSRCSRSIAP